MPECSRPVFVPDKKKKNLRMETNYVMVPCGKCPNCLKARASAWSFRLMQEDKISSSSSFITLTYDTKFLPITRNGYATIRKRDLQLFFKRLRKNNSRKIRYYAVGEYGGKLKRPHYHIILFNADIRTVCAAWGKGHVHYGSVSGASVGYTLKYISKPYKNFRINDDREKPFSLMSKGLGASYLSERMVRWHKADLENRMYVNLEGGKKCTMPRYYKDRMYSEAERKKISDASRHRFAEHILKDLMLMSGDEFEQRNRNRAEGFRAQKRQFDLETLKA